MDPTLIPSDGSAAERPEETGGGLALDPEADLSILKLEVLLKDNPKFRRSWEQDRKDMNDQSASAYDLSMATIALGAGWPDQGGGQPHDLLAPEARPRPEAAGGVLRNHPSQGERTHRDGPGAGAVGASAALAPRGTNPRS